MPLVFPSRFLLAVAFAVLTIPPLRACLNDYQPNVAAIKRSETLVEQLTQHPTQEPWTERRDRLRKLLAEGGDFRVKNDLATSLLHTGEAAEAVTLLEAVEAEKPGLYFTAANLGTAYELAGDDQKAIEWIRKGIERNPEAHEGTEWLHVRILETKIAIAENPKWLEEHSILETPAEGAPLGSSTLGNRGESLTPQQIKAALIYQLHERLQFVKPPDAVVGALLLDLGDLVAKERSGAGSTIGIVKLAAPYLKPLEASHPLAMRLIVQEVQAMMGQRTRGPGITQTRYFDIAGSITVMVMSGIVALLVIFLKRRIQARLAKKTA